MTEVTTVATWLYGVLAGDEELASLIPGGVHETFAPVGTAYPFITFNMDPQQDTIITGNRRLMATVSVDVKAVTNGSSFSELEPIAARVDELLHGNSGTAGDGMVIDCRRESPIRFKESAQESGLTRVYLHLGGQYTILAQ